jgi:hypothetical protein
VKPQVLPAEGGAIGANHRRYLEMDAQLRQTPCAIRTHFFAAAACVTHPSGGLGILDGAIGRWLFTAEQRAFLRFVHHSLAAMNRDWHARLLRGVEVAGCEGRRGRDLDHALVDLEQAMFTRATGAFFGADDARRMRVVDGLSANLRLNPLLRCPLLETRLRAALAAARARCRFDLADEATRRSVGHALVDQVRADRVAVEDARRRAHRPAASAPM